MPQLQYATSGLGLAAIPPRCKPKTLDERVAVTETAYSIKYLGQHKAKSRMSLRP